MPINAIYLQNRHLSPKVRVFVDWVSELFAGCPLLSGCGMAHDQQCGFAGVDGANTIRTWVEQQNIAEAMVLSA